MARNLIVGSLVALMLLALSACSGSSSGGALADESAAVAEPTFVPVPTFTPTPIPPPTPEVPTPEAPTPEAPAEPEPDTASPSDPSAEENSAENGDAAGENETLVAAGQGDSQESDSLDADEATGNDNNENAVDLNALLAPTPTPEPSPRVVVTTAGINLRRGPGTVYEQVGAAAQGDTLAVIGRNPEGDWWQVCCVAGDQPAWVYAPLVEAQNADAVAVAADIPAPPAAPIVEPVALAPEPQPESPAEAVSEPAPAPAPEPQAEAAPEPSAPEPAPAAAAPPGQPAPTNGTAGNFDPNAQYQIVHFRTLGYHDNNGGIFNKGGQQLIFLNVLDQNGNGVNGVVVKNANADNLTVITGDKGPGKAEIKMDWDPYKLYVVQDGSGPVTSHVSNQMNNPYPHIPDIVGLMGPVDLEYAICPAIDDRCNPPFYHAHWSYEITFQKVR